MRKFALFALVAALSFGLVGCVSSLERNWGLKEMGVGTISDLKVEVVKTADDTTRKYLVQISYCGRTGTSYVSRQAFDQLYVGQVVELRLRVAITRNVKDERGDRFCIATYGWVVPLSGIGEWIASFNEPTEHQLK